MGYQPVVSARIFSPIGRVFNLRTAGTLCATLALTGIATGYPLTPARADDRPITAADQAYYSYYHLDSARAKGYTGAGVTIAIIDGPVDTSVAGRCKHYGQKPMLSHVQLCPQKPRHHSRFPIGVRRLRDGTRCHATHLPAPR